MLACSPFYFGFFCAPKYFSDFVYFIWSVIANFSKVISQPFYYVFSCLYTLFSLLFLPILLPPLLIFFPDFFYIFSYFSLFFSLSCFVFSLFPFLGFSFLFFLINYIIPQTWLPSRIWGIWDQQYSLWDLFVVMRIFVMRYSTAIAIARPRT